MSKTSTNKTGLDDDLPAEIDFARAKIVGRGVHAKRRREEGYSTVVHREDGTTDVQHHPPTALRVVLEPDVAAAFPTAEAVNTALRSLMKKRRTKRAA